MNFDMTVETEGANTSVVEMSVAPRILRARRMHWHPAALAKIAICVIPPMALVAAGQFNLAAYTLFFILGAFVVFYAAARDGEMPVTLVIATIPVLMLLRGLFIFSALQVLLAGCLLLLISACPREWARVKRNKPLVCFLIGCLVYWLTSFILTGDYSSNLRVLEFGLAAANVFALAGRRSHLATAFAGIAISTCCMGAGLLPHGERLGISTVSQEISIGNPISLGLSSALVFLFTIADRGKWLLVENRPYWRIALNVVACCTLALSTSRGSWLVNMIGLIMILLLNRTAVKALLVCLLLAGITIGVLLQTDRGPVIQHYFETAVSGEGSLAKRTTGRADQWESFGAVFSDSPLWGFGPGSGKAVSLRYTLEGKPWHSLYLLIGAETGLLGLTLLTLLLATLFYRGFLHLRRCGEIGPLLGIVCLSFIGVSVSGIDAISGVYLGIAFIACDFSGMTTAVRGRLIEEHPPLLAAPLPVSA
ncbi:MAG: Lipid core-O-antigen ligase-like enyme [Bryobacterales bacterium]|nr:Lipid core-O-antigen ligase-like enyme [Bryobacterales bacterium]